MSIVDFVFLPDLRRSVRWWNLGQPELLRAATTPRDDHHNFKKIASDLRGVPIRIWHGEKDEAILPSVSEYLVSELRTAGHNDVELSLIPGGTHFSLVHLKDGPLTQLMERVREIEVKK